MMISKFTTVLKEPEDIVIQQLDDTDSMFLISDGACQVKIIDEKKNVRLGKLLRSGDYFGEISLIYACPRSATISSTKYSTMAQLSKASFKEILISFPNMVEELKKGIFLYNDKMKRFIIQSLEKIEYFQDIGEDALHDIIYNLQTKKFQEDEILQEPGDNATQLFFLQDGVIEIFTKIEGEHEFMLEKLFRGSIINYRTFFMEDDGKVYYRFGRNSICSILSYDTMEELIQRHTVLRQKFLKFKKETIINDKPFPLDYIMNMPKHLRNPKISQETQAMSWRLEN